MADDSILPYPLDDIFASQGIGSLDKAIGNNLYGINHRQTPNAVVSNKDTYGLTFFVRPQLNMQKDNLRNVRQSYPLLTDNPLSMQSAVRCTLDPRLMAGYISGSVSVKPISSPLVDNTNAFISVFTNNLNSISGWPDETTSVWTSRPGLYNETFSMPDGISRNFGDYTLDASFRNVQGDPTLMTIAMWRHYMAYVREGKLVPYLDYLTNNVLDFTTRIYRLVLDQQKNRVTKIFACGSAFPVSAPTGSFADFNKENPYNDQNKDITIRFHCTGFDSMDDILVYEFNKTVQIFQPGMRDANRDNAMVKLTKYELPFFNNRGNPRINTDTYELEWWVTSDLYQIRSAKILQQTSNAEANVDTGD